MNRARILTACLLIALGGCQARTAPTPAPAPSPAAPSPNDRVMPAGYVSMQTRIFVPNKSPYDKVNWAETLMGQVIAPLVARFPDLRWYWFSRYVQPVEGGDRNDTDLAKVPKEFFVQIPEPKMQLHRSLRFRFCLPAKQLAEFEAFGETLINAQGCAIADWREWDLVGDVGSGRHIGEDRSPQRCARRADAIARFYHATSVVALNCLVGPDPDGYFRFEQNNDPGAPLGSSFEVLHHGFCNITEVPLCVMVTADDKQIHIGTFVQPPPPGTRNLGTIRIRY